VEDEETLQTGAVVGNAADLVEDLVDELLSDGVVTTGVVVRGILLACDHLLGVEEGAVRAGANLVDDVGLKIGVDGTGDILALTCAMLALGFGASGRKQRTSLGEEGAEAVVVVQGLALLGEETIGLDAVLEAVELRWQVSIIAHWRSSAAAAPCSGECKAAERVVGSNSPPSKSLRSGNRPGRLDAYKVSINK
jgi:hypothetical protein